MAALSWQLRIYTFDITADIEGRTDMLTDVAGRPSLTHSSHRRDRNPEAIGAPGIPQGEVLTCGQSLVFTFYPRDPCERI